MKPRNKFEAQAIEFCKEIRTAKPITNKMISWSKNLHEQYFTTHYSNNVCLECGHSFKMTEQEKEFLKIKIHNTTTCPSCQKKLSLTYVGTHGFRNYDCKTEFFSVYDVHKGHQVERIFAVDKYLKKGQEPSYSVTEVIQKWINENGKIVLITRDNTNAFGYYDSFSRYSKFEVRDKKHIKLLWYSDIYPRPKFLPKLIRNGFDLNLFKGRNIASIMVSLLTDPFFEQLVKMKQIPTAIAYEMYRSKEIIKYKNQIRIASKHGFIIKDVRDYIDHLRLLEYFQKDLNSPKYLCPDDFHAEHQKYIQKKRKIDEAIRMEERAEQIKEDNKSYIRRKRKYFNVTIEQDGFKITVPKKVEQFYHAGNLLNHCIATNRYFEKPTLILFAEKDGVLLETAEIDLKRKKIIQCRGYKNNPTEHNDTIVSIIKNNIHSLTKNTRNHVKQN